MCREGVVLYMFCKKFLFRGEQNIAIFEFLATYVIVLIAVKAEWGGEVIRPGMGS